ncbi:MAG: thiamine diphosphokinase [Pseudomonadota bacterium]
MIVEAATLVTLLGGGELGSADLGLALKRAPTLVAADGGAVAALRAGRMPDAVIGDLDSLPDDARSAIADQSIFHLPEQDTTDFDKALRAISAPGVIAVGCMGGRLDHELAAFHSMISPPVPPCILLGQRDVIFSAPAQANLELALDPGARVSLFPMLPVHGQSTGLRWPIEGLDFAPDRRIGTSNEATDGAVKLRFGSAGMLVILPRRYLDAAIAGRFGFPLSSDAAKV